MISTTGSFHEEKNLAYIGQFVFFEEKPPDKLIYKKKTEQEKTVAMQLHTHAQDMAHTNMQISRSILTSKQTAMQNELTIKGR